MQLSDMCKVQERGLWIEGESEAPKRIHDSLSGAEHRSEEQHLENWNSIEKFVPQADLGHGNRN